MKKMLLSAGIVLASTSSMFLFAHPVLLKNSTAIVVNDSLPSIKDTTLTGGRVEQEAYFPGGEQAWRQFLMDHLDSEVPVKNHAPVGKYMVIMQFIVDKEGAVTDITPLTRFGYGMEAEVIRLLQQSPKWHPAQQNGRLVKAYRKQPITFVVQEEKRKRRLF